MRDMVRGDVARVLIDDAARGRGGARLLPQGHAGRGSLIELTRPRSVRSLRPGRRDRAPCSQPSVELASGGWITIETTEALTAIDVNSGRFTQSGGLEETSLAVNLEAASEIGRQIRLRGIGGLIVVDFIHLARATMRRACWRRWSKVLRFDRAPVQISPMTRIRHCRHHPQAGARTVGAGWPASPAPLVRGRARRLSARGHGAGGAAPGRTRGRRQSGGGIWSTRRAGRGGLAEPACRGGRPGAGAPRRRPGAIRSGRAAGGFDVDPPLNRLSLRHLRQARPGRGLRPSVPGAAPISIWAAG